MLFHIDSNGKTELTFMVENGVIVSSQYLDTTANDLAPLYVKNVNGNPDHMESCILSCNEGSNSQIKCLSASDEGKWDVQKTKSFPKTEKCYKASSFSPSTDTDPSIAVFSTNFEAPDGQIKVFKVSSPDSDIEIEEVQTIECHMCSDADVGSYKGEIFIAGASMLFKMIQVVWSKRSDQNL